MFFAHSANRAGQRHTFADHTRKVEMLAQRYALALGNDSVSLAALTARLHDIGKCSSEFQQYLLGSQKKGPPHKWAGALLARQMALYSLAFSLAGHHGGLLSEAKLKVCLREWENDPSVHAAIAAAQQALPELGESFQNELSPRLQTLLADELLSEFFLRMLFSVLVDADFLDTEAHFAAGSVVDRAQSPSLSELWRIFEEDQRQSFSDCEGTPVNILRDRVYHDCLQAATHPTGFFRLTVPTGGGKTRSSLAFALRHANEHGLQRIIYAIPFMSITEQTADTFRKIFPGERIVLEHHSGITLQEDGENPPSDQVWSRLSTENWDASLIVTTTVQLFESLMDNTPSGCRKLHRIAGSILILDEAQMLPTRLLTPILDILNQLVEHYGVTVVLCTATQPSLDTSPSFQGLGNIHEIVSAPEQLFAGLKRVEYQLPQRGEQWTWNRVAMRMRQERQALTIVNTRADASHLLHLLQQQEQEDGQERSSILYLSTRLCGVHRRDVLNQIRYRLRPDVQAPCHLVSTQVIEAGVDVDFPLVLRAIASLDRIAQAAGRCNREGKLMRNGQLIPGQVIVFDPAEAHPIPRGSYSIGIEETRIQLRRRQLDLHDPWIYQHYFRNFYDFQDLDECDIQALRRSKNYPEVARAFRVISDTTYPVVVHYPTKYNGHVAELIADLRKQHAQTQAYLPSTRDALRRIQPYVVGLRKKEFEQAKKQKLVADLLPGLWEWRGEYDSALRGILLPGDTAEAEDDGW